MFATAANGRKEPEVGDAAPRANVRYSTYYRRLHFGGGCAWASIATTFDGSVPTREPRSLITCDNFAMARTFVEDGIGFMIETYPLVAEAFRGGRLVEVLPNVRLRPVDVYAIYPANAPRDSLARLFVDYSLAQKWLFQGGGKHAWRYVKNRRIQEPRKSGHWRSRTTDFPYRYVIRDQLQNAALGSEP